MLCKHQDVQQLAGMRSIHIISQLRTLACKLKHWTCLQAANHVSSHSVESLRANAAAVASATLEHLMQHLRRGKTQVLWERMLLETHARVAACLASGMCACLDDCVSCFHRQLCPDISRCRCSYCSTSICVHTDSCLQRCPSQS